MGYMDFEETCLDPRQIVQLGRVPINVLYIYIYLYMPGASNDCRFLVAVWRDHFFDRTTIFWNDHFLFKRAEWLPCMLLRQVDTTQLTCQGLTK